MSKDVAKGISAMLVGVAVFSVMDASMKHLAQSYPPLQVSSLRGLASIPFFLLGVAFTGQWRSLVPVRWIEHLIRGGLAVLMLWMFVYSVSKLSLGTAYGIVLCAPLLITALSALVLREHVGPHRWLAIFCGLIGVVIILNPDGQDMATLAGLAAVGTALCYAIMALMIRRLTRTDTTLSIGLSFVAIVGIGCGIAAYPRWVPLSSEHWPWIAVMGLSGAMGQYLIIQAFRLAQASVVAPFEYTALLWGIALDWVLWSTVPGARVLSGAGVVIASGLYLIYREHWLARNAPVPTTPIP
jgi:drug/metabolite transporter (DMT)-like permease